MKISTNNFFIIFPFFSILFFSSINLIFSTPTTFFVSSFNQNFDCVDLSCETNDFGKLDIFDDDLKLIDISNGKVLEKCSKCNDCTNSGYSTCMQPLHFNARKKQLITEEGTCNCISNGPMISNNGATNVPSIEASIEITQKCKVLDIPNGGRHREINEPKLEKNEAFYRLCYSSALRKLPVPKATNEALGGSSIPSVLVTVEQFWNDKYWQKLKPYDLQLFYVFPVTQRDFCENGDIIIPNTHDLIWMNQGKASTSGMPMLCKSHLEIQMEDDPEDLVYEERMTDTPNANYYHDGNLDLRMPQEVQFERNVFAGAERVRFFYEVTVVRENQLKAGAGKPKFEQRRTLVKSDALDYELHPEIYGTGMEDYQRSQSNKNESSEQLKKGKDKLTEKDKDKYEMHTPIVRPIKTKGREKSFNEKTKSTSSKMKETTPQAPSTEEENNEREATTLVPIPSLKIESGKIETVQQSQSSPLQPALTSNSPQTQMSSTSTFTTENDKVFTETDTKDLNEAEKKKIEKEGKDEDWLLSGMFC
uniref:Uncharacterized protein n=1 Tax=Meloidogyne enterolobii TaxID=390850 RepID=A0A6V7XP00_MELEN|nr:unnamed protein product [Meloidogyne enterolobii]